MGFQFPNSPTAGQVFQPAGGPTYTYQNGAWVLSTGAGLSDAPSDGHEYARKNATWVDVNQMRSGAGAPIAALGDIGDYYINSSPANGVDITAGTIYGPKATGSLAAAVRTLGAKNPAAGEDISGSPWYFGNRFTVVVAGLITKLWVYKSATASVSSYLVQLWRYDTPQLLWTGTVPATGAAGWYSVDIPGGIWLPVAAKFSVVAQILTNGKFGSTGVQTSDSPTVLTIDGATDGPGTSYPTSFYNNANFWTDVSFAAGPNIWPVADQPLLDAPYSTTTFGRKQGLWVPVPVQSQLGVFKISESTGAFTGAAQIDIALPTGYKSYELSLNGILPATNATAIGARFSFDNGATYKAGASDYGWSLDVITMISVSGWVQIGNPATSLIAFFYAQSSAATSAGHVKIFIPVAQATAVQRMDWHGGYLDTRNTPVPPWTASGAHVQVRGMGIFSPTAGAATNIRILAGVGNLSCQSWQLNGIA